MQVAVLTEQLHAPVPGGSARYTSDLLAALDVSPPPGSAVVRWTARHRAPRRIADTDTDTDTDAEQHQLVLGRRSLSMAWSFGVGPVPEGADLVHAPTPLAPPRRDRPLVVTIHDDVPWTHPQTLTRNGVRWHRRIARRIGKTSDQVVTPTSAVASRLLQVIPGLTAARLLVAANPLPRPRAERLRTPFPDEQARASRLGLPGQGYLLFVGTREPRKGLDVLLSALSRPAGPRLPLLIVGPSGWGSVNLDRHQNLNRHQNRVRVLGRVDDDDLGVIYRQATTLVLPSRAEGFGYPVVEAMTAGTPVVISDDPALVETGGGAALTSPVGDAPELARTLRLLEDDAGLRRELVERARLRARDFTDDAYGRTMWQLYATL